MRASCIAFWRAPAKEEPIFFWEPLGTWVVTRYDDVKAVLDDTTRFTQKGILAPSQEGFAPEVTEVLHGGRAKLNVTPMLGNFDGPDHQRLRQAIHRSFTPRRVKQLDAGHSGHHRRVSGRHDRPRRGRRDRVPDLPRSDPRGLPALWLSRRPHGSAQEMVGRPRRSDRQPASGRPADRVREELSRLRGLRAGRDRRMSGQPSRRLHERPAPLHRLG